MNAPTITHRPVGEIVDGAGAESSPNAQATAHEPAVRTRANGDGASVPAHDGVDLVVLDAHGVVFNRAFPVFVRRRAIERGDEPAEVWHRWRDEHRQDFWEGRTTPAEMWAGVFPGDCPARLSAELERMYRPGPLFRSVATGSDRVWLLSNHRSGWLLPRLERFGLADRFERVLISDQIGAAKPHPAAFEQVLDEMNRSRVLLLDDSAVNVAAASRLGIDARIPTIDRPANTDQPETTDQPARRTT